MSAAQGDWYRDGYRKVRSFDDLSTTSSSAAGSPFVQKRPERRQHQSAADGTTSSMSNAGESRAGPIRRTSSTYIRGDPAPDTGNTHSLPRSTKVMITRDDPPPNADFPRPQQQQSEPIYANLPPHSRHSPPAKPPRRSSPPQTHGPGQPEPTGLARRRDGEAPDGSARRRGGERRDSLDWTGSLGRADVGSPGRRADVEGQVRRRGASDTASASDTDYDVEPISGTMFKKLTSRPKRRAREEAQSGGVAHVKRGGGGSSSVVLLNTSPASERRRVRSPPPHLRLSALDPLRRPVARVSSLGRYDTRRSGAVVDEYAIHRRAVEEAARLRGGPLPTVPGPQEAIEYIEIPRHFNERAIDVGGEEEKGRERRRGVSGDRLSEARPSPGLEGDRQRPSPAERGKSKGAGGEGREKRIDVRLETSDSGRAGEKPVDLAELSLGRERHRLLPHDFSSLPRPGRQRQQEDRRGSNTTVVAMNADYATLPRRPPQTSRVLIGGSPPPADRGRAASEPRWLPADSRSPDTPQQRQHRRHRPAAEQRPALTRPGSLTSSVPDRTGVPGGQAPARQEVFFGQADLATGQRGGSADSGPRRDRSPQLAAEPLVKSAAAVSQHRKSTKVDTTGQTAGSGVGNRAPFPPIHGNTNKILFVLDDVEDGSQSSSVEKPGSVNRHAPLTKSNKDRTKTDQIDFGNDEALTSFMRQNQRLQAEAEALQSAILSSIERPKNTVGVGLNTSTLDTWNSQGVGSYEETDPTVEKNRNLVLSELRHFRKGRRMSAGDVTDLSDGQRIVYGDNCVKVIIAGGSGEPNGGDQSSVKQQPAASASSTLPRPVHKSVTSISAPVPRSKSFSSGSRTDARLAVRRKPQRTASLHSERVRRPPDPPPRGPPDKPSPVSSVLLWPARRSVGDGEEPPPAAGGRRDPAWVGEPRTDPSGASSSDDDERSGQQTGGRRPAGRRPTPGRHADSDSELSALKFGTAQVTSRDLVQYFQRLKQRDKTSEPISTHRAGKTSTTDVSLTSDREVLRSDTDEGLLDRPESTDQECVSLSNLTEVQVDSDLDIEVENRKKMDGEGSEKRSDSIIEKIEACTQETKIDDDDGSSSDTTTCEYETGGKKVKSYSARETNKLSTDSESSTTENTTARASPCSSVETLLDSGTDSTDTAAGVERRSPAAVTTSATVTQTTQSASERTEITAPTNSGVISPIRPNRPIVAPKPASLARLRSAVARKTGPVSAPASPGPAGVSEASQAPGADVPGARRRRDRTSVPDQLPAGGDEPARRAGPADTVAEAEPASQPLKSPSAKPDPPAAALTQQNDTTVVSAANSESTPDSQHAGLTGGKNKSPSPIPGPAGDSAPKVGADTGQPAEVKSERVRNTAAAAGSSESGAAQPQPPTKPGTPGKTPHNFVRVIALPGAGGAEVSAHRGVQTGAQVTPSPTAKSTGSEVRSGENLGTSETAATSPADTAAEKVAKATGAGKRPEEVEVVTDEKTNSFLVMHTNESCVADSGARPSELRSLIARSREARDEFVLTSFDRDYVPKSRSGLADYFAGLDSPVSAGQRHSTPHRTPEVVHRPQRSRSSSASPSFNGEEPPASEQPTSLETLPSEGHHFDEVYDDFDDSFDFGGEEGGGDYHRYDHIDSDEHYSMEDQESNFSESSQEDQYPEDETSMYKRPLDFTLTTIIEESCEESDGDDKSSEEDAHAANPSELERYFFFDIGDGPHDPKKFANEESECSDTFSETSGSVYSEFIDPDDPDVDPVEQASSRYFPKGFLGLNRQSFNRSGADDSENQSDGSGSVGSDSESPPSPALRRRRLTRSRLRAQSGELDSGADAVDLADLSAQTTGSSGDERLAPSVPDDSSSLEKQDDQSDTLKRRKKRKLPTPGDHSDRDPPEKAQVVEVPLSSPNGTKRPLSLSPQLATNGKTNLNKMDKTGEVRQSRDSGFLGSSDDLLKESVLRDSDERQSDGSNRVTTSDSSRSEGETEERLDSTGCQRTDVRLETSTTPASQTTCTSDEQGAPVETGNNSSSDGETYILIGRLREFFTTAFSVQRAESKVSNSKPHILTSMEAELTRLMKTVPGLNEKQVREIVEYLSGEDTRSDSCDSSDYTGSDLDGACAVHDPAQPDFITQIQLQISQSCQQIIEKYDKTESEQKSVEAEEAGRAEDVNKMHEKLVDSLKRLPETRRPSSNEPPPMLAEVMQHIGDRLVAFMHEFSTTADVKPHTSRRTWSKKTPDSDAIRHRSARRKTSDGLIDQGHGCTVNHRWCRSPDTAQPSALVSDVDVAGAVREGGVPPGAGTGDVGDVSDDVVSAETSPRPGCVDGPGPLASLRSSDVGGAVGSMKPERRGAKKQERNGSGPPSERQAGPGNSPALQRLSPVISALEAGDNPADLARTSGPSPGSCSPDASSRLTADSDSDSDSDSELEDRTFHQFLSNLQRRASAPDASRAVWRGVRSASLPRSTASSPGPATRSASPASSRAGSLSPAPETRPRSTLHMGVSSLGTTECARSARYRPPGYRPPAARPVSRRPGNSRVHDEKRSPLPSPLAAAPGGASAAVAGASEQSAATTPDSRSVASLPASETDDDIDSIVAIHRQQRASDASANQLSTLGSRSGSLASVYSSGEVRFGTVSVRGDIQLALRYNHQQGALEVNVRQCRDLAAADHKRQRSDPYVKVYLLPDQTKSGKRKTKTKKHTLNPVFQEVLRFAATLSDLETRSLWVSVWHSDMFGRNHFLGEVTLPLSYQILEDTAPRWHPLQERGDSGNGESPTQRGDLIVALKFSPPDGSKGQKGRKAKGSLHVMIKEAKNLVPPRTSSTVDSFCKCHLLPERRHSKLKTSVVKRSLNPRWSGALTFDQLTADELRDTALELTVWHHGLTSSDLLAGARLNLGTGKLHGKYVDWMDAVGQEVSLWEQMLERPGFWVESSLPLRADVGRAVDK